MKFHTASIRKGMIFLAILAILVISAAFPVIAVKAAGIHLQDVPPPVQPATVDFDGLLASLKNLGGIAALIAVLVNVGKRFNIVKDGQSGSWSAGLNILALIGLLFAQSDGYTNLIPVIDAQAGQFSEVISVVLAFAFQLFVSRKTHASVLSGLPLIGKSHTGRVAGESITVLSTTLESTE